MQKLIYRNPNGEEIDFTSGDFGVTKWSGFSKVDMDVQSQQVPFHDGSVFLDALLGERELSITVAVNDDNNLEKRYRLKRELIHCLNPKLGEGELIYTNDFISKKIVCVPDIPEFDNKNMNDSGTMKAMCSFTASNPYWEDVEETYIPFSLYDNIKIENNGDVPCSLKINLFGNKLKNPKIRNILEKKEVSVSGEYTGTIMYNFLSGKKSVSFGKLVSENTSLKSISLGQRINVAEGNGIAVISGVTAMNSTDGYNWESINNIASTDGDYDVSLWSVFFSENFGCFFGTKGANTDGIYKSYDGKNWARVSSERIELMAEVGANLYGIETEYIKKSVDGGATWETVYTSSETLASIEANDEVVIVKGSNAYISSDGATWNVISMFEWGYPIIWDEASGAFFCGTYKSTDGTNWTSVIDSNFRSVIYNPSMGVWFACTDGNKIYSSSDGGDNWTYLRTKAFGSAIWLSCAGRAVGIVLDDLVHYKLLLTYDFDSSEAIYFPTSNSFGLANDKKIVLGGNFYLDEFGWHPTGLNLGNIAYKCGYGKGRFLVGVSNRIYYSDDCKTWNYLNVPFTFGNCNIIYSEGLNKFFCGSWASTDGISWTKITEESIINVYSFETPNGTCLYATYGTIIKRSRDGITWVDTGIRAGSLCYSPSQNMIYAVYNSGGDFHLYKFKPENDSLNELTFIGGEVLASLSWSEQQKMFIGSGGIQRQGGGYSAVKAYISVDGNNWTEIPNDVITEYVYIDFLSKFIGDGIFVNFVGDANLINAVSENSDMDFILQNGQNQFRWMADGGTAMGQIIYKQKYLGV